MFEWHGIEGRRQMGMLRREIDRLYAFCGAEPTDPDARSDAAQDIHNKVAAMIASMVAPELYGSH